MKYQLHKTAFYNYLSSQCSDTQYIHLQTLIVPYGMVRLYSCLAVRLSICLSVCVHDNVNNIMSINLKPNILQYVKPHG